MSDVDKRLLLLELGKWKGHGDLLVHSVAAGLSDRVARGDFDVIASSPNRTDKEQNGHS